MLSHGLVEPLEGVAGRSRAGFSGKLRPAAEPGVSELRGVNDLDTREELSRGGGAGA